MHIVRKFTIAQLHDWCCGYPPKYYKGFSLILMHGPIVRFSSNAPRTIHILLLNSPLLLFAEQQRKTPLRKILRIARFLNYYFFLRWYLFGTSAPCYYPLSLVSYPCKACLVAPIQHSIYEGSYFPFSAAVCFLLSLSTRALNSQPPADG